MTDVFSKKEKAGKTYYYVADRKYKNAVRKFSEFESADAIAKELDDNKNATPNPLNEDYFYYSTVIDDKMESVPLPLSTYKLQPENYPVPERLEIYPPRTKETYIQLPELDLLKADLHTFLGSKDIYEELGFPYRRGYLLHGRPGNGKTALIRSILTDGTLANAHIVWMNGIPTDDMVSALNAIDSLKVVVFEEIVNQNEQVNFDLPSLLAFMDGEGSLKNCITIATTNYPQHLGENLANRPSRFDVVLEFKNPSDNAIYQMLEQILKRTVDRSEFVNKEFSFAQIKEMVLLTKMFNITLNEAANRLEKQSRQFDRGFEKEKIYGFSMGSDD